MILQVPYYLVSCDVEACEMTAHLGGAQSAWPTKAMAIDDARHAEWYVTQEGKALCRSHATRCGDCGGFRDAHCADEYCEAS